MIEIQAGVEAVMAWAISNADPSNMVLIGVVYYKLTQSHSDLQQELLKLEGRVEDLHDVHNGDE